MGQKLKSKENLVSYQSNYQCRLGDNNTYDWACFARSMTAFVYNRLGLYRKTAVSISPVRSLKYAR